MHGTAVAFVEYESGDRLQEFLLHSHHVSSWYLAKRVAKLCFAKLKHDWYMHWRRPGPLAVVRGAKRAGRLPTGSICRYMETKDRILVHLNRPLSVHSLPCSVRRERQLIGSYTNGVTILCMKFEQTNVESSMMLPLVPW